MTIFRNAISFLINYCVFECFLPTAIMAAVLAYWQSYVSLISSTFLSGKPSMWKDETASHIFKKLKRQGRKITSSDLGMPHRMCLHTIYMEISRKNLVST